jgi:hypothetical protein
VKLLSRVGCFFVASAGALGCASSVEVTQTYTPAQAMNLSGRLEPVAVEHHQGTRTELPAGARVEKDRVVLLSEPDGHVYKLKPGDVIEQDADGRIVAVRSPGNPPSYTRFIAGTASSLPGSDEVRGRLAGTTDGAVMLAPDDRIEMRGRYFADERLPDGGHVASSRSEGTLFAGIIIFAIGYAPSAYFGAASHQGYDRVLLVPVAGPWIDLGTRPKCVPPPGSDQLPIDPCIDETAARVGLIAGGVVQGVGALMTALGLPAHAYVSYDQDRGVGRVEKPHVSFVPMTGGGRAGGFLVGTF